MVKVILPLGSVSVHGRLGGVIFQTGNYGQVVRGFVSQRRKISELQYAWRLAFGITADDWRLLTDEQKEELNLRARGKKMTGFNLYIKENIQHNYHE